MNIKQRLKHPMFWIGVISTFFAAGGVDINTLTSWTAFVNSMQSIFLNPVACMSVVVSVWSIMTDTSTPGLLDGGR